MEPTNPVNPSSDPPKPPSDPSEESSEVPVSPGNSVAPSINPPETETTSDATAEPPTDSPEVSPDEPSEPSIVSPTEASVSDSGLSPASEPPNVTPEAPAPGISQVFTSDKPETPPPPPFAASTAESSEDSATEAPAVSGPSPSPSQVGPQPPQPGSQLAQPQAMPKVMVGDGGVPAVPGQGQASPIVTSAGPAGAGVMGSSAAKSGFAGKLLKKKVLIPVITAIVVLGGAAAFYFGYYMNPSVVYSQALSDTGKGYDKLVDYADKQTKTPAKGYTGSGSYTIKASGSTVDGNINFKTDNKNADLAIDIGAEGMRVNADFRTIKGSAPTPDVYMKVSGIKGFGTVLGAPQMDSAFAKLDNNWIVVDHTLIDQLSTEVAQSGTVTQSDKIPLPTREQLLDEARAFGKVNKEYLFTTNKDKAVTKVVKTYGKEKVDGHSTYHYLVALQKDQVKQYILAQRDALKASKLNDYLKKNNLDTAVYKSFDDAANSAKDIKSTDTFDLWADTSQRVVYKIRVNDDKNPASNYVDIGLNYKGGSDYPFFLTGKSRDDSSDSTINYSLTADINTKTGQTGLGLKAKEDGSSATDVEANFSYKPSQSAVNIEKPANAIPISQVLSDLGMGDVLSTDAAGTSGGSAGIQLRDNISASNKSDSTSLNAVDSSWLRQLLKQ